MDAKKCDRCGRFYEEWIAYGENGEVVESFPSQNRYGLVHFSTLFSRNEPKPTDYDLCPACEKSLKDWVYEENWTKNYTKEKTDEQI